MDDSNVNNNSLPVKICGENVTVYADGGPEYIERMANYINYIIDRFVEKKGANIHQNLLLLYASLELCNAYFTEKDAKMTPSERNYEKQYQMEVFSHKKTSDMLSSTQRKLEDTEKQLKSARKELDEFISAFDVASGGMGKSFGSNS